ncbi:MAG: CDP-alcohol phosphatidyltransferase family protein [Lawsonella clevelandensis]
MPVFIWLLVGKHDYIMAFVVLIIVGVSDWADGKSPVSGTWNRRSAVIWTPQPTD